MPRAMSVSDLQAALATPNPPIVLDVRREANLLESPAMISGAKRIQPEAIAEGEAQLARYKADPRLMALGRKKGWRTFTLVFEGLDSLHFRAPEGLKRKLLAPGPE